MLINGHIDDAIVEATINREFSLTHWEKMC